MAALKDGPVEQPSMANGAQVALEDFNIPQFPREAGGLMALTLISQISLDQYSEVLRRPFKVTHLPPSIQSLTLESFALGYPPGFLKALIAELPELRSLVVYSQSFTSTSDETADDAVAFIKGAKKLRALHLLDAFISPAFVKGIVPLVKELEKPLMFTEINYTNRNDDESFMKRIPAAELPLLIHQGLISCSFNISPPEGGHNNDQNARVTADGIQTLDPKYSEALVTRLLDDESAPKVMKHLNITLYPLSISQLRQLVTKHKGLMVMNVSIEVNNLDALKKDVFRLLSTASSLEHVEIVLCPPANTEALDITVEEQEIEALGKACKRLSSFKVNQLRCQRSKSSVECTITDGKWKIETKTAETIEIPERAKHTKPKTKQAWSPWT